MRETESPKGSAIYKLITIDMLRLVRASSHVGTSWPNNEPLLIQDEIPQLEALIRLGPSRGPSSGPSASLLLKVFLNQAQRISPTTQSHMLCYAHKSVLCASVKSGSI